MYLLKEKREQYNFNRDEKIKGKGEILSLYLFGS